MADLIALCVYLFGFTITGCLAARIREIREDMIALVGIAFFWPLVAAIAALGGLVWLMHKLFTLGYHHG